MTIKINDGSKLNNLSGKLRTINIYSDDGATINFWLTDTHGNESLTYLTTREAIELRTALMMAINDAT